MFIQLRVQWLFLAFVFVMNIFASQGVSAATKINEEVRPETLTFMNRDLAIFRANLNGATPIIRVENALKRIRQIETNELSEDIRAVPFTLAGEKGFQFHLGNRHLFSIIEKDLDPESNQQMDDLIK